MEDNEKRKENGSGSGVDESGRIYFVRLNFSERVQHLTFLACFIVLIITGFMVKTPEQVVKLFGSAGAAIFMVRSILHRTAGTIIILVSVYHAYYLIFKPGGRRLIKDMIPCKKDIRDIAANFQYYAGVKDSPPEFDRFSYKQKIEYSASMVGHILMSITGLILWTEYLWDKFYLDLSTVIHGMEAVLACLAIIIWHLYEVHLKPDKFPLDNTVLTGLIDEEEMKEEHLMHYKKIMADPELQDIYIKKKKGPDSTMIK